MTIYYKQDSSAIQFISVLNINWQSVMFDILYFCNAQMLLICIIFIIVFKNTFIIERPTNSKKILL